MGGCRSFFCNHVARIVLIHENIAKLLCSQNEALNLDSKNVIFVTPNPTPNVCGQARPVHSLAGHQAAVKALAWCPFQSNLLATGGGTADRCIKFWNTSTGAMLNSIDTGSQVEPLNKIWDMRRINQIYAF